MDIEEEDRGLADGDGGKRAGEGKEEGGEGYGGHGCLSVTSWTHLRGGRRGQGLQGEGEPGGNCMDYREK